MAQAILDAKKTKATYAATFSQAQHLQNQISANKDWSWADHVNVRGDLDRCLRELNAVVEGDRFVRDCVTSSNMQNLNRKGSLEMDFRRFSMTLDPVLASLAKASKLLVSQQRAREDA